jgi:biotin transport system substrate-specific component
MKTYRITLIGLFAAVTAICAWITIPLPFTPVPINLATFGVMIAGAVLGSKYGSISQLIYILIGLIGLPVFSGFSGGLGHLLGPTGGYIFGYILIALIVGKLSKDTYPKIVSGMVLGTLTCYTVGSLWFMYITDSSIITTLSLCVLPFIPGDVLKIFLAVVIVKRIPKKYFL